MKTLPLLLLLVLLTGCAAPKAEATPAPPPPLPTPAGESVPEDRRAELGPLLADMLRTLGLSEYKAVGERLSLSYLDEAAFITIPLSRGDEGAGEAAHLTVQLCLGAGGESYLRDPLVTFAGTAQEVTGLSLSDLPTPSYDASGSLSIDVGDWLDGPAAPLAHLPEAEITLYGLTGKTGPQGILLRRGAHLDCFALPCQMGPRMVLGSMSLLDCDGDGTEELLVVLCTGTGTGISVQDLQVFRPSGEGFVHAGTLSWARCVELAASALSTLELPGEYGPGAIVDFSMEDGGLTAYVGIEDTNYPHTLHYVGGLKAQVVWDGDRLSLDHFTFLETIP